MFQMCGKNSRILKDKFQDNRGYSWTKTFFFNLPCEKCLTPLKWKFYSKSNCFGDKIAFCIMLVKYMPKFKSRWGILQRCQNWPNYLDILGSTNYDLSIQSSFFNICTKEWMSPFCVEFSKTLVYFWWSSSI